MLRDSRNCSSVTTYSSFAMDVPVAELFRPACSEGDAIADLEVQFRIGLLAILGHEHVVDDAPAEAPSIEVSDHQRFPEARHEIVLRIAAVGHQKADDDSLHVEPLVGNLVPVSHDPPSVWSALSRAHPPAVSVETAAAGRTPASFCRLFLLDCRWEFG